MVCSACNIEKDEKHFHKDISISRGYSYKCKICKKNNKKSSKPKILKDGLKWCNCCKKYKEYNNFSICKNNKNGLCYRCSNCCKEYYNNNIEKYREYGMIYRYINKDKLNKNKREYHKNNKDKINNYLKERRKNDKMFLLKTTLRSNISKKLNNYLKGSKQKSTFEILGCTFEEFAKYLESKFEKWMNWENRGLYNGELNYGWDLDHIIPLCSAKNNNDVYKLNHYTNFQPLCSKNNRDIKWKN